MNTNIDSKMRFTESSDDSSRKEETLCDIFRDFAKSNPGLTAVVFNGASITYRELDVKSDKVSEMLRQNGTKAGDIVGLFTKRTIEMITGMLGILKAGAAFLPIDPDFPAQRIRFMLEDSEAKIVLSDVSFIEMQAKVLSIADAYKIDIIKADNEKISPTDLAYVIYTSGSTGKPKGVMIEHQSVVNFINGITEKIDFSIGKRILALTTISFDIFVLETLIPLAKGVTIILAGESAQKNPKILKEVIINNNIDMLQMTPSRIQLLINHEEDLSCLKNLKEIMIGGESLQPCILEKIKRCSKAKIYNMYGPTEATVWAAVSDLTDKDSIDIGKPVVNTQIYIIDEDNSLVADGHEGELCIGGKGLARGYLNRAELTEQKFIDNPFGQSGRIYKTGDLARRLPDGNIECLGRKDNQVKIRGHRVELGEIETALLNYKDIKQAVVAVHRGTDNTNYLCAYFVSNNKINPDTLREYLRSSLPDFMIPAGFIRLETIPQTPNGKIDRNALLDPGQLMSCEIKGQAKEERQPIDYIESKIMEFIYENIDADILSDSIDIDSNLADIGIDSINFIKVIVSIETEFEFGFENEYLEVDKLSTIKSLVDYTRNKVNAATQPLIPK